MGNCIRAQIDEQEHFDQEYSISQSYLSITSEVEKHMYFNNFDNLLDYNQFKKMINYNQI